MRFLNFVGLTLTTAIATVKSAEIFSCTVPNTIALTFDDGPSVYTDKLLEQLKTADIRATFFINGNNWLGDLKDNPEGQAIIGRVAAAGHQVASHTYNHLIPPTNEERAADLKMVEDLVEANAGYRPNYFRAPRGECDEACLAFIESLGYKIINWDTDTNDWNYRRYQPDPNLETEDPEIVGPAKEKAVKQVKEFLTEEFAKKKESYLVLMHDVQSHTVEKVIPWLLKNLPEGYKFVTVAECLGDESLGKASGTRAAFMATTTQQPTVAPTVIPGNSTYNLQANTSGANTVVSNLFMATALLVGTLYMLL